MSLIKVDMAKAIHQKYRIHMDDAKWMVDAFFETLTTSLCQGHHVKLHTLGAFTLRDKLARKGRNPSTGTAMPIPPRRVVTFKPSKVLNSKIDAKWRDNDGAGVKKVLHG